MSTEMIPFEFESNQIRVINKNGEPWFVARDIAHALGYSNPPKAVSDHCKKLGDSGIDRIPIPDSGGFPQDTTIINEKALYYFLIKSKKSEFLIDSILSQIKDSKIILEALNNFEIPDDLPDMYVYAIKESESGNIKLGISRDPERRLKQLQTGNSQELKLLGYRKAQNGFKDEKLIHDNNFEYHIRGEWFNFSNSN